MTIRLGTHPILYTMLTYLLFVYVYVGFSCFIELKQ